MLQKEFKQIHGRTRIRAGTAPGQVQVHPALLTAEDLGGSTQKVPQLLAFSFILFFFFSILASIPSGHGAGQAFEAFFFLHAHLMVWCWGSLGGTRSSGAVSRGCASGVRAGHEAAGAVLHPWHTHTNCPGMQILPCNPPLQSPPGLPVQAVCFNTDTGWIFICYVSPWQLFTP